jgi:hypothetical protein
MSFAFAKSCRYKANVNRAIGIILLFGFAGGCGPAREVGHVVTAPVRLVHRGSEKPPQSSDVATPGHPVTATPTPTPRTAQAQAKPRSSPSAPPKVASTPSPFPVAKAVPGKPGLVYNPFDPKGGLIDVSGYASGSKVKDPDSQKIFIVP